jgi:hypothetical protein
MPMAETLDLLKSKRDELTQRLELEAVQAELTTLETLASWLGPNPGPYSEEFGQPIDRAEMLRDIGWGSAGYLLDDWNSRSNGDDRPILETETQLAAHRARSRLICHEVPPAIGALRNLQNYIVGTKWAFPVVPREKDSEQAQAVAKALGIVVDLILESNMWIGLRDKETYRRTVRDGDGFIRVKLGPDGIPRFQFAEPCWVTQPRDPRELNHWLRVADKYQPNWKWGILTADNDHATPLGYHVVYDGRGDCWDFLTPDEFHHIKVGTDEGVKRGISEFYCVRNHFPRGDKVFQMVADGAAVQAAIAGVRQFTDKAKTSDIEAINANARTHTRTQGTQWGTREVDVTNFDRPKVISAKGYDWKEGPMGASRNPNLILAGQAILRLTGARWNMPEWMTTGDASNNNLASSLVAESPFVKACEADQTFYGHHFVELIWKAVKAYLRSKGQIAGFRSVQELRAVCEISSSPPAVASRDALKEIQVHEAAQRMGIRSRKTIATQLGDDYDVERPQIEDEPPLPGTAPAPMAALGGAVQGALESSETAEDVKQILREIREEMANV